MNGLLSDADVKTLLDLGDERIALALAANDNVSQEALALVAKSFPSLHAAIALQAAAPPDIKDAYPLSCHSGASLERYVDDRLATQSQRVQFFAIANDVAHGSPSELLGAVWERVVRAAQ